MKEEDAPVLCYSESFPLRMYELKEMFPGMENLAPEALQWILQFNEVSCSIPGASRPDQVLSNFSLYELEGLGKDQADAMISFW